MPLYPPASSGSGFSNPMTTPGDVIYGGASGVATRLAAGTSTQLLLGGTTPSWAAVNVGTMVTGTLAVGNGGTGSATQNFVDLTTNQTSISGNKVFTTQVAIGADPAVSNGARALYSSGLIFDSRVASSTSGISFRTDTSSGQSERLRIEATGWVYVSANTSTSPSNHSGFALGWNKTGGEGESAVVYNTAAGSAPRLALVSFDGVSTYTEEASLRGGKFGIGQAVPTAVLHLKAGTASANTAPIKLTSGVNLTTPEAGTIEYDGSYPYFSPTATTNARAKLALTADNFVATNQTVAATTATNVTGLSFNIPASTTWSFEVYIRTQKATTSTGLKVAITVPTSATIEAQLLGTTTGATANVIERLSASGTLNTTALNTATAADGFVRISGVVVNSTNAGAVQVQIAGVTDTNTVTIFANSYITARKV